MIVVFYFLLAVLLGFSLMAVFSKDILFSVIFLSASSLSIALIFFMLNAPDIAITKAAVESGLVTTVYIVAIQKTKRREDE